MEKHDPPHRREKNDLTGQPVFYKMQISPAILKACALAGHAPNSPAGKYFVGMALVAESMATFKAEIDTVRTAEPGNDILTISQTSTEYQVSESWLRARINRANNPIPLFINDNIQRIKRHQFETWLGEETARRHARPIKSIYPGKTPAKPELRIEFQNPNNQRYQA